LVSLITRLRRFIDITRIRRAQRIQITLQKVLEPKSPPKSLENDLLT